MTVSGQESCVPHTMARMQELTAINVRAVLFTGLFREPGWSKEDTDGMQSECCTGNHEKFEEEETGRKTTGIYH